jgi:hypothetical protein
LKENEHIGLLTNEKMFASERLDFILSHFEEPIWPRTISTHTTEGRQALVFTKEEALARFKQANHLDCRINAFSAYTEYQGINRQAPNLIDIDLDKSNFKTERSFNLALNLTLRNIKEILGATPTVLWTGNGVHILLPLHAIILEQEEMFSKFEKPSRSFLLFAERHLSNNKSDPAHNPSFKSCLIRIPSSYNSKYVQRNHGIADSTAEVRIIQKWDGHRPNVNPLLYKFYIWIAGKKIAELNELQQGSMTKNKIRKYNSITTSISIINWIERLLHSPIADHRKFVSHWILSRYLINVRHINPDQAYAIIKDWEMRCNEIMALSPAVREFENKIKSDIKEAIKNGKAAIGEKLLKDMNNELYKLVFSK